MRYNYMCLTVSDNFTSEKVKANIKFILHNFEAKNPTIFHLKRSIVGYFTFLLSSKNRV